MTVSQNHPTVDLPAMLEGPRLPTTYTRRGYATYPGHPDNCSCGACHVQMFGVLNAGMFGTPTAPGEHVDWSTPDYDTAEGWDLTFGCTLEEVAAAAPHLIIFQVGE